MAENFTPATNGSPAASGVQGHSSPPSEDGELQKIHMACLQHADKLGIAVYFEASQEVLKAVGLEAPRFWQRSPDSRLLKCRCTFYKSGIAAQGRLLIKL